MATGTHIKLFEEFDSIMQTALAMSRFRYQLEKAYEKTALTTKDVSAMRVPYFASKIHCQAFSRYSAVLMRETEEAAHLRNLPGEEIFQRAFGSTPREPVGTTKMPYGTHLFLYLPDLLKICPDFLENRISPFATQISPKDLRYHGRAFLDRHVSVGIRTFATSEESEKESTAGKDHKRDSQNMQRVCSHELEHLLNSGFEVERTYDEFLARTTTESINYGGILAGQHKKAARIKLKRDYDFISNRDCRFIIDLLEQISELHPLSDPPETTNFLNAILFQIGDLGGVRAILPKIADQIKDYN